MKTVHISIITGVIISTLVLMGVFMFFNQFQLDQKTSFVQSTDIALPKPVLSDTDKSAIIDAAMNVPGIKTWSNQWQYSTMNFIGEKTSSGVTWKTATVVLHMSPTAKASFSCDSGWVARVDVDLATKKVLHAYYPTVESHSCHGIGTGPISHGVNYASMYGVENVTVNGLKDKYFVGDKIDFSVTITGHLHACSDFPTILIQDMNHKPVWTYQYPLVSCPPDESTITAHTINSGDDAKSAPALYIPGKYQLIISDMNMTTSKELDIIQ